MHADPGSARPSFDLTGKVAIVTGGASGIGSAIAGTFAAKGAVVAILDVQADKAAAKAAALGPGHSAAGCDVTDPESVRANVARVAERHHRIDILVNSAGIVRLAPAEELSVADWDATMSVNVRGTFLMCQQAGAVMLAAGRGRIVNLASQAATVALDQHAAYCASKAAVLGLHPGPGGGVGQPRRDGERDLADGRAHRTGPPGVVGGQGRGDARPDPRGPVRRARGDRRGWRCSSPRTTR